MKAFEIIRHWDEQPVTVFAADLPQAENIFRDWIRAHHPEWGEAPMMVHTYEGKLLEERSLLASASKLKIAGVAYWDPTFGIWMIAKPDEPSKGPLVPPASGIHYYRVNADDGDESMVFARSFEECVTFYLAWSIDAYGAPPQRMEIRQRSRFELVMNMGKLRDELESGLSGMAGFAHGVWRICEPVSGDCLPGHAR